MQNFRHWGEGSGVKVCRGRTVFELVSDAASLPAEPLPKAVAGSV